MRRVTLTCLAVAATAALSSPASAGKNKDEAKRLARTSFMLVLIIDHDGSKHVEAIENNKQIVRRKDLDSDFAKVYKLWAEDYSAFRKDVANRGKRFRDPAPRKPQMMVLQRSLRGKAKADEARKWYDENVLQPALEKEEAILEKMRAKAGGGGGGGGGGGRRDEPRGWGEPEPKKKLPKGNLLKCGNFEDVNPDTRFARGWAKGQWGNKGIAYQVRMDKSGPHGGNHAVFVRAMADGAKAGVSSTLTVEPGTYEVRYWACSDVGKSASVGGSFAKQELTQNSVGEDWRQFRQRIVVKARQFNTSLRLWSTTSRVRVFFDDVELEAVQ